MIIRLWRLWRSLRFMDKVARSMGVNPAIHKAALTEAGVDYRYYMELARAGNVREEDYAAIGFLQVRSAGSGAAKILERFPEQLEIHEYLIDLERFAKSASAQGSIVQEIVQRNWSIEPSSEPKPSDQSTKALIAELIRHQMILSGVSDARSQLLASPYFAGYHIYFCFEGTNRLLVGAEEKDRSRAHITKLVTAELIGGDLDEAKRFCDQLVTAHRDLPGYVDGRMDAGQDWKEWVASSGKKVPLRLAEFLSRSE